MKTEKFEKACNLATIHEHKTKKYSFFSNRSRSITPFYDEDTEDSIFDTIPDPKFKVKKGFESVSSSPS